MNFFSRDNPFLWMGLFLLIIGLIYYNTDGMRSDMMMGADELYYGGDYEEAIKQYTKVIEKYPKYEKAYLSRGNAYFELEKYQEAIADYTRAIEIKPKYEKAYFNRGLSKKKLGIDDYCSDYKKACELGFTEGCHQDWCE